MPSKSSIPAPTVKRLSLYLRELESSCDHDDQTVSSQQLGRALGITDAQVRKDLAFVGQTGHPGIGYNADELANGLRHVLGTDRAWHVTVIGAGKLGRALMGYGRFSDKGFDVAAVFDADPQVVGTTVAGHRVRPLKDLEQLIAERGIRVGIVATPAEAAQAVTDRLVKAGVKGILNFAPIRLHAEGCSVVDVDLTLSLEQLVCQVSLGINEHSA